MFVRLLSLLCLAAVAEPGMFGQCPLLFRTEASALLATGVGSHFRVVPQNDGSYSGYEVADVAPYPLLSFVPHFETQLTECRLTSSPFNPALPEAVARLRSGNYLYIANVPNPLQSASSRALLFDTGFRFISENDYPVNGLLALADLNGDGNPDIIAGQQFNRNSGVSVLLGNGGSSFQTPVVYGTTALQHIAALAAGDVDGDGKVDVVLAAVGSSDPGSHVWVLYGNGDGTLGAPVLLASAWGNQGIAIGDLNRDGIPDLAFTVGSPINGNANYVMVMLGQGGRHFTGPTAYPTGGSGAVAIGDVDGDGNPDVVTNGVTVYFGDGKGGLPRRGDWFNDAPGNVILADFNGDGKTDIVIGNGNASVLTGDRMAVLYNNGGDFSGAPVSPAYSLKYGVLRLESADLNRDGIRDVVLSDLTQIVSLLGNGDGTFRQAWVGAADYHFALGDFNGDGIPDMTTQAPNQSGPNIALFVGKGDGTFLQSLVFPFPQPIEGLAAGDFNGDGKLDVAVLSTGPGYAINDAVTVYLGDGKGGLGAPATYPVGPVALAITVADFNRDGRADIAVAAAGAYQVNNGEITLLLSTATGFVRSAVPFGAEAPYALATADLNGDGLPDLAVQFETGRAATLLGRGDGTFSAPAFLRESAQPGIGSVVGFAAGDLDGDGRMDLVGWGGNPGIWLGKGDGTFAAQIPVPEAAAPFVIANFGGNRLPDLIMGDSLTGVAVFVNEHLPRPRHRGSFPSRR